MEPLTLYEFLEQTGARVRGYDLGRRIGPIARDEFVAFERATAPYPRPMQRQAWFGLVQVAAAPSAEPLIWFLRLDLDEQGLLVQAGRDYLLGRLLESAQADSRGADPQVFLQDNPYAFTPREDRMALFNALLRADLGLPPSRFYAHALDYFHGRPGWSQWGFVGYQGIADVACRHHDEPLSSALAQLPPEPLVVLCHCLESRAVSPALGDALIDRLRRAAAEQSSDIALLAALLRGLAGSVRQARVAQAMVELLQLPLARHIEVLAAISGRAWELLLAPGHLRLFLERLAENPHGQPAFEHCVADLLSLPALAPSVRNAMRDADQSAAVRTAFERMLPTGGRDR